MQGYIVNLLLLVLQIDFEISPDEVYHVFDVDRQCAELDVVFGLLTWS